jgi:hypothetical protein
MDKGEQGEPLETVRHPGDGPLAAARPDGAQEGLEPDALLVAGPDRDVRGGMRCAHLRHVLAQSVGTKAA